MRGAPQTLAAAGPEDALEVVGLLERFFREESFDTPFGRIEASLRLMLADPCCWVGVARDSADRAVAVITVTTMLSVEWGRLGEIGDLYVEPASRGQGLARRLIEAACAWCAERGCSAVSVVVTPEGDVRHGLKRFYARQGFAPSGRTISTRMLATAGTNTA